MKLTFETLKDKITGCWNGKNIGGVLGAPLEGRRGVFDVSFYLQENLQGNPPPNDDLDLQLVWLAAVERYGRQITPEILGEYWLTFITPDWAEYGRGKANTRAGLVPPLSGYAFNSYHNSCGCFIRSELWACLCPGNPDLAVKYAYRDAVIDHGEDGMYGELFCAALQSAAFVESDRDKLIEIGLSYIPSDCLTARAVRLVMECREEGLTWQEARTRLMREVPGTFGVQSGTDQNVEGFPTSPAGNDAPNNIGILMIGWLYGDNDFGKSLCIAVNCGEDTDCTAGTLGAILGIVNGNSGLPEKWLAPIGGVINTVCIERTKFHLLGGVPGTVEELTERILRLIPGFLDRNLCTFGSSDSPDGLYTVSVQPCLTCTARADNFVPGIGTVGFAQETDPVFHERFGPLVIKRESHMFLAYLDHLDGMTIRPGEVKNLMLTVEASAFGLQQWLNIHIYGAEGVEVRPGRRLSLPLQCTLGSPAKIPLELYAEQLTEGQIELLIDISLEGRHSYEVIKTRLFVMP